MEEENICDCFMDLDICNCKMPISKMRKERSHIDPLERKAHEQYFIRTKTVIEFDNILAELGLKDKSMVVENLIIDFIEGYRGRDFEEQREGKNMLGKTIDIDIYYER